MVSEATIHSETTKNTKINRIYYIPEGRLIVKKGNKKNLLLNLEIYYLFRKILNIVLKELSKQS